MGKIEFNAAIQIGEVRLCIDIFLIDIAKIASNIMKRESKSRSGCLVVNCAVVSFASYGRCIW